MNEEAMADSVAQEPDIPIFKSTFAVQLQCKECVEEIKGALHHLEGVHEISASLETQTVAVLGSAAPSAVVQAIEATGRNAIIRGSGTSNSAAVSILELHDITAGEALEERLTQSNNVTNRFGQAADLGRGSRYQGLYVKGLVRLVEVAEHQVAFDVALTGLPAGSFDLSIQQTGDISNGAESTGPTWYELGVIDVNQTGTGNAFFTRKIALWETIGRAMVLKSHAKPASTIVGVIARSAGVWENNKTVCACSGMTVWEERAAGKQRGVL